MQPSVQRIIIILATGVLAVSTAAIFIRLSLEATVRPGVGFSLFLAAGRLIIASLIILPTYPTWGRVRVSKIGLIWGGIAGLCLALHFAFWITSLSFTSIAASTTLVTTNPLWIALISWIWWGEKPTPLTSLGILIAIIGSGLIGLSNPGDNSDNLIGNILALLGALMASLYLLSGRIAQNQGLSTQVYIAIAYSTAAIILLPLPLLWGESYLHHSAIIYFYILLMAIFPQLIGHTSFNWAIRYVSPTIVALVILLEPIGAIILGLFFLQEIPGISVISSALIVLFGTALAIIGQSKD